MFCALFYVPGCLDNFPLYNVVVSAGVHLLVACDSQNRGAARHMWVQIMAAQSSSQTEGHDVDPGLKCGQRRTDGQKISKTKDLA